MKRRNKPQLGKGWRKLGQEPGKVRNLNMVLRRNGDNVEAVLLLQPKEVILATIALEIMQDPAAERDVIAMLAGFLSRAVRKIGVEIAGPIEILPLPGKES